MALVTVLLCYLWIFRLFAAEDTSSLKTITIGDPGEYQTKIAEFEHEWGLHKTLGDDTYDFIFEWNCFCSTCLQIPKWIRVQEQGIASIEFSDQMKYDYYESVGNLVSSKERELELKLPPYGCDALYLHSKHYHDIDGLFEILKKALHPRYYDPNRHIISMTFDSTLKYPKTVYISNDLHELGWNIKCLSMANGQSDCSNVNAYPFWIERQWQEIIGWLMIGVVFLLGFVSRTINWLKQRARDMHRKRLKASMSSNEMKRKQPRSRSASVSSVSRSVRKRNRRRRASGGNANSVVEEQSPSLASGNGDITAGR